MRSLEGLGWLMGLTVLALGTTRVEGAAPAGRPHIVLILADDLGWKDVGYHGSEIRTPHIDRMAAAGARLEQFYVQPVCSPTRASLMTGRYPMRMGLQTGVIRPWARYGLPLEERMLPQALREAGYRTAITGKWHLGQDPAFLPTRRGFDHQYGHYTGAIDYFTHVRMGGFDWHRNDRVLREEGYSTELIGREAARLIEEHPSSQPLFLYVTFNAPHTPLQAPEEYLAQYGHIADSRRRTYAAMVTCMDTAVGRILAALEKRGMTGSTLVVFSSDNGGPIAQAANNGPLRGAKGTLYEGGVRVPAWAVWPGRLKSGVVNEPLHMADWYPTLLKLAGASLKQRLPLDGHDAWPTIAEGKASPREEILHNVEPHRGALRCGPWKLVVQGKLPLEKAADARIELFNLSEDPEETHDRASSQPETVRELLERLNTYARAAAAPKGGDNDPLPPDWKAPAVFGEQE
jgi:arylsulfatase A-like enzyme